MTYPEATITVRQWLIRSKTVSHQKILDLVGDPGLQRLVIESLVSQGIAADEQSLRLIWTGLYHPELQTLYDVFVSYSRLDNENHQVDHLINELGKHYLTYGKVLNIFFDRPEIRTGELWWDKICDALHHSKMFLAFLSPNYLDSEICKAESQEFIRHQNQHYDNVGHALDGPDAILPVLIGTSPIFMDGALPKNKWVQDMLKHHVLDLTKTENRLLSLASLADHCYQKLNDAERLTQLSGSIPPFFKEHVFRGSLVRAIFESLSRSDTSMTGLYGLPGTGKSTLAFSYAHTYRRRYPGGCWHVPADGRTDIRRELIDVARLELHLLLEEDEEQEIEMAWRKLKKLLERQYFQDPAHLTLFIIDNITDPDECCDDKLLDQLRIPGVNMLFTSLSTNQSRIIDWLPIGGMEEEESLSLLSYYRVMNTTEEKEAASTIIRYFQGLTLGLTIIGSRLSGNERTSYQQLASELRTTGLHFVDHAGSEAAIISGRYLERRLTVLLNPLLNLLQPPERTALDYAALLSPEVIPLPWLEELLHKEIPDLARPSTFKSDLSQFERIVRKLKSLSLLNDTADPALVSMHSVLYEFISSRAGFDLDRNERVQEVIGKLATKLHGAQVYPADSWVIPAVIAYSKTFSNGSELLFSLGVSASENYAYYLAKEWFQAAINFDEMTLPPMHTILFDRYYELANAERHIGYCKSAEQWADKAWDIADHQFAGSDKRYGKLFQLLSRIKFCQEAYDKSQEFIDLSDEHYKKHYPKDHAVFSEIYADKALLTRTLGKYQEAREWMKRSIRIDLLDYDEDADRMASPYGNLALIEKELKNFEEAKRLQGKAIAIMLRMHEEGDSAMSHHYDNLSIIERNLGNLISAKKYRNQCLAIQERIYTPDHPNIGNSYQKLALIEEDMGNLQIARTHAEKAMAIHAVNDPLRYNDLAHDFHTLASIELKSGNRTRSHQLAWEAFEMISELYGVDHPVAQLLFNFVFDNFPEYFKKTDH